MAAASYMTVAEFKAATLAPASYVDVVEAKEVGWTLGRLTAWSRWLDARLRKRYAAPFTSPYPEAVLGWLTRIMTWEIYLKRGVDATDGQIIEIKADAVEARLEVKEAADSVAGLFDLPLRADTTADGISKPAVLGYAEASPYTWMTAQQDAAEANGELP